jgi:hypothetical protein
LPPAAEPPISRSDASAAVMARDLIARGNVQEARIGPALGTLPSASLAWASMRECHPTRLLAPKANQWWSVRCPTKNVA